MTEGQKLEKAEFSTPACGKRRLTLVMLFTPSRVTVLGGKNRSVFLKGTAVPAAGGQSSALLLQIKSISSRPLLETERHVPLSQKGDSPPSLCCSPGGAGELQRAT